ncbi:MAG: URC4/urg3 family protein [Burkholderiales bacterium]|nr:URC4/urg3 family protein [Burkholderiales bacterium]
MNLHTSPTREQAEAAVAELRTTVAVRERCRQLLTRARHGESRWFVVDDGVIDTAAGAVVEATRKRYPRLHVPFHSRWRHFGAGGVDRKAQLDALLQPLSHQERARAMVDLAVASVLLDAGAGAGWKYVEPATGIELSRSEGLAVASFHAFTAGLFSSRKDKPLQADSTGLRALVTDHLANAFQVTELNPLVGLEGRAVLMRRLGEVMAEQPGFFGTEDPRPAGLFDLLANAAGPDVPRTAEVNAHDILSHVLMGFAGIWPAGNAIAGIPLGDCWRHAAVRGEGLTAGWVPFHKLSQWLTYSLLEPFAWGGVTVERLDQLTALPEYRNGGLLVDTGVLRIKDESATRQVWQPGDEIVVEWRAMTVALMDEVAESVRRQLHLDESSLPLASVLEGGSWAAGRELAERLRGGLPPLQVASDGTLF